MIHIGFTGTRHGMTDEQAKTVLRLVGRFVNDHIACHHGDCVGADKEFHSIARRCVARLVGHLPVDERHRAFCSFDETRKPLTHFARNRAIVFEADVMIAAPRETTKQLQGGTWYTIGQAEKSGKPLAIVTPNGEVAYFGRPWPRPACEMAGK